MKKNKKSIITKTPIELAAALGLDQSITLEWQLRSQVTDRIISVFDTQKMKITDLAKKAKTSRARITNILNGDTSGISLDVLLRVLSCMGQKVKVSFSKAA